MHSTNLVFLGNKAFESHGFHVLHADCQSSSIRAGPAQFSTFTKQLAECYTAGGWSSFISDGSQPSGHATVDGFIALNVL